VDIRRHAAVAARLRTGTPGRPRLVATAPLVSSLRGAFNPVVVSSSPSPPLLLSIHEGTHRRRYGHGWSATSHPGASSPPLSLYKKRQLELTLPLPSSPLSPSSCSLSSLTRHDRVVRPLVGACCVASCPGPVKPCQPNLVGVVPCPSRLVVHRSSPSTIRPTPLLTELSLCAKAQGRR
jgi:hypothetical protein